eukprot:TRINITY_DN101799_c0_g1_i1.p1 TRINITY_DN101799_c0_g1~~TRINITY_DN101799_c0_g1_i1.p1  ORF type:complete len:188 (+),score=24.31 TRINITY_DN101799_c0_g1_i1:46-609(+)
MLSLNQPLRRNCSGQVGGPRGSFKCSSKTRGYRSSTSSRSYLGKQDSSGSRSSSTTRAGSETSGLPPISELGDASSQVSQGRISQRSQLHRSSSECSFSSRHSQKSLSGGLPNVMAFLDKERHMLQRQRSQLSSAGSLASSRSRCSSCPSQAVRSTVLDLELMLERERREAAEKELDELKAKLKALG